MHHQVDLTWTYSNRRDLADLLRRARRWVSEDRQGPVKDPSPSVRAKSKETVPRRVIDHLGEETARELIEARRVGAKPRELVERYEVSESSLKRLLRGAAEPPAR